MDNYIRAFSGEVQRDGAAQAFGRAGDQSDFSTELAGIRLGGRHRHIKKVAHLAMRVVAAGCCLDPAGAVSLARDLRREVQLRCSTRLTRVKLRRYEERSNTYHKRQDEISEWQEEEKQP